MTVAPLLPARAGVRQITLASARPLRQGMLLLILLVAFGLRVWRLGWMELGGDEGFSYDYLSRGYFEIIQATLSSVEPHPIGSYVLFRTLRPLFGESEFALRFISAWAGIAAVALVYRLGQELRWVDGFPQWASLLGAALMAVSPFSLEHSRHLRMYALTLMFALAATVAALAAWRSGSLRALGIYLLSGFAALHMHYYAATALAALNLFWLLQQLRSSIRRTASPKALSPIVWLGAQVVLVLAYAPWLIAARSAITGYWGNADFFDPILTPLRGLSAFVAERLPPVPLPHSAGVAASALLVGSVALFAQRQRWSLLFLALYLLLPVAVAIIASVSRPIFRERYFIVALSAFCLLFGAAVAPLFQGGHWLKRLLALAVCLAVGGVTYLADRNYFDRWNASRPALQDLVRLMAQYSDLPPERVRLVINFPEPGFDYYYNGAAKFMVMPYRPADLDSAREQVDEMVQQRVARVLLQRVESFWDPYEHNIAATALSTAFTQIEERFSGQWVVKIYGRREPDELKPVGAVFSQTVTLAAANVFVDARGELLELGLSWRGEPSALRGSEKQFIHIGPVGQPYIATLQRDPIFTTEDLRSEVRLFGFRLSDLPPGDYEVRVGIYDPMLPNAARWQTNEGKDLVIVGQFRWR
ncbi:MAG: glycosyltransferase family 39 protein [Anaerolineae bacterium]|nr:glycosyltransferase family 39 protein [Anaerolineae bacterium]